jgi:O-antigen ligase
LLFAAVLLLPRWIADPFQVMTRAPDSWSLPGLLVIGWFALAARRFSQRDLALKTSGLEIYQAALFCLAAAGVIVWHSDYFDLSRALMAIVFLFGPMLGFHFLINLRLDREQAVRLCKLVVTFGAGIALLSLRVPFQYLPGFAFVRELAFGPLEAPLARAYSPIGGPYLTGPPAAALVPLCAALSMSSRGPSRFLYLVFGFICLAAAILSVQRVVVFSLISSAFLFLWLARELVRRNKRLVAASAISAAVLVLLLVVALRPYINFARLVQRDVTSRGDRIRIASVRAGVEAGILHPILGGGIGRYFPRYGSVPVVAVEEGRALHSPHSLPLLAFSEMGLPGMLLVLILLFKPAVDLVRLCRSLPNAQMRWVSAALACGALVFAVDSVFAWALASMPRYALFVWLFLGLAYRTGDAAVAELRRDSE